MKSWLQVVYETNGFLEKNRDLLHADLLQLLASCDCALPQLFGASIGEDAQKLLSPTRRGNGGTESQKQSVAAKFKVWFNLLRHPLFQALQHVFITLSSSDDIFVPPICWSSNERFCLQLSLFYLLQGQLYKLMQRLESTEPHFIRCIKPNALQLPNIFEQELVLQQLRCCGVLEVVRISRSGYPTRHSHDEFASRYRYIHTPLDIV